MSHQDPNIKEKWVDPWPVKLTSRPCGRIQGQSRVGPFPFWWEMDAGGGTTRRVEPGLGKVMKFSEANVEHLSFKCFSGILHGISSCSSVQYRLVPLGLLAGASRVWTYMAIGHRVELEQQRTGTCRRQTCARAFSCDNHHSTYVLLLHCCCKLFQFWLHKFCHFLVKYRKKSRLHAQTIAEVRFSTFNYKTE